MINNAYSGLRVIDVSQGIAGPCCGQMLKQLGADVIKIEPIDGDWSRKMGLGFDGLTPLAVAYNRGKRSIALNLKAPEAIRIMHDLVKDADVFIQNFRPKAAESFGTRYEELGAHNPQLIYASISGFGAEGPVANCPVTDSIAQAVSGLASSNAGPDGKPRPVKPYIADIAAGIYTSNAISAALFARERFGRGCQINISLLAALAALQNGMLIEHAWDKAFADVGHSSAKESAATVPQGVFESADGFVTLASLNNSMFATICKVLELHALASDGKLGSPAQRLRYAEKINQHVADALRQKSSAEWTALFDGRDVLFSAINDLGDFVADPRTVMQALLRDMTLIVEKSEGSIISSTLPIAQFPGVGGAAGSDILAAPFIGEHTDEVMVDLGYETSEIERLERTGVLGRRTR